MADGFKWTDFFGSSFDDPKTMMWLGLARGMLEGNPVGQNRATLGQSLSRGLLGGMEGYQQGMTMKRQGEKLELEKKQATMREQQLQAELDAKRQEQMRVQQQGVLRGALPGLLDGQGMTGPQAMAQGGLLGSVGPTRANAQHMLPNAGGVTPQYLQAALTSGMKIDEIKTLAGAQQWNTPKVGNFFDMRNPDGSVTRAGHDEYGKVVNTGAVPFKDQSIVDFGGHLYLRDPITNKLQPLGKKTMTPGEEASNAVARGNLDVARGNLSLSQGRFGLEQQRFNADQSQRNQPIWSAEHGGFITRPGSGGQPGFTPVMGPDGKPISAGKAPTEFQSSSAGYAVRMAEAGKVMNTVGESGQANTWNSLTGSVPLVGSYLQRNLTSTERQQVKQAEDDWIRAKLRRESGAVIATDEMESERQTYFPMPGDGPEVIAQKARARQIAEQAMMANAGPAHQAVAERVAAIPSDNAQQGPNGEPPAWAAHYVSIAAAKQDARRALMQGAPKVEVIRRLEEMGIKNHGLK